MDIVRAHDLDVPGKAEPPERLYAAFQKWEAWLIAVRPQLPKADLATVLKAMEAYAKQVALHEKALAAFEAGADPYTGEWPEAKPSRGMKYARSKGGANVMYRSGGLMERMLKEGVFDPPERKPG